MIDNGEYCPVCKKNQMPPWKSQAETARRCQECGLVEERQIRKRGYYWIIVNPTKYAQIGYWNSNFWSLIGTSRTVIENVEVKGKVIEGEWTE